MVAGIKDKTRASVPERVGASSRYQGSALCQTQIGRQGRTAGEDDNGGGWRERESNSVEDFVPGTAAP